MLKRVRLAVSDCFDGFTFWSMGRGGNLRFAPSPEYEDLKRLNTMAALGESLYEIQIKIANFKLVQERLELAAKERCADGAVTDSDLWRTYRQIRETEIQCIALAKSERILKITLTGLENQATIDRMRKVLTHTVHQHRMVQQHGMLDINTESQKLMETFEQMTDYITNGQTAIDNMADQSTDMQNELQEDTVQVAADHAFVAWKDGLRSNAPKAHAINAKHNAPVANMALNAPETA